MPAFAYRGRKAGGDLVKGVLEGNTATAVADALFGTGVTPLEIRPVPAAPANGRPSLGASIEWFGDKVGHIDILLFTRQLHTLLKAGVPIMRALAGLQDSSQNSAMKSLLGDVRQSLESGHELSASLSRHPQAFSNFYLAMVRIGEMTGRLEEIFLRLFDHMEFERFMREQVKAALRYPSFVIAAMAVALFVVNVWVIPTFAKVFQGFNAELPTLTRFLIGFSEFSLAWWHGILGALAMSVLAFRA